MNQTNPKPFVFVLMPFHSDFDDIYQVGIKAACLSAGAYCERVDEQTFDENILDRVYNQISKADIIVSEMTGRNPNVFYETGYAHALNKRVILLTQNAADIPFDLKHYPHIVYEGKIARLKSELEKRIKWSIDNPTKSLSRAGVSFEYHINDIALYEGIEIIHDRNDRYIISVHNTSNSYITTETFELALIIPANADIGFEGNGKMLMSDKVILPDKRASLKVPNPKSLFPDDWFTFIFYVPLMGFAVKYPIELSLRLFSEIGPQDLSFKIVSIETEEREAPNEQQGMTPEV